MQMDQGFSEPMHVHACVINWTLNENCNIIAIYIAIYIATLQSCNTN